MPADFAAHWAHALDQLGLPPDADRAAIQARLKRWTDRGEWEQGAGRAFWLLATWLEFGEETARNLVANGSGFRQTPASAQAERAVHLANAGMSRKAIARELGVSLSSIGRYLSEARV